MVKKTTAIEQMEINGGSFVKALAEAMRRADKNNFKILENAFPGILKDYQKMADIKNRRNEEEEEEYYREDQDEREEDNSNIPEGFREE